MFKQYKILLHHLIDENLNLLPSKKLSWILFVFVLVIVQIVNDLSKLSTESKEIHVWWVIIWYSASR